MLVPARAARSAVSILTALKDRRPGTHQIVANLLREMDPGTKTEVLVLLADIVARTITDDTLQAVAVDVADIEGMVRM